MADLVATATLSIVIGIVSIILGVMTPMILDTHKESRAFALEERTIIGKRVMEHEDTN